MKIITNYKSTNLIISEQEKEILSHRTLKNCPFKNYYAINLLFDLINMYSWKLEHNKEYNINQFLEVCNCAHATVYKKELTVF